MAQELPAELIQQATYRRGRLAVFDRIQPKRTALLVIDMQNAWLKPGAPFETPLARRIVPAINRLAAALRQAGGQVVWIQHENGPGHDWPLYFDNFVDDEKRPAAIAALQPGAPMQALWKDLEVAPGDWRLPKHRFSAFLRNSVDIERSLRDRGIDTVIVAGTATNMCCESTARDAMMLDFRVFMPHDAVTAARDDAHRAGLRSVMQNFADVRGTEEVVRLIGEG